MSDTPFADASILVVDDHPAGVLLLERLLESWGYDRVATTTDATQVVGLVERTAPDLLLLDLNMPGISGLDILRQLRPWTTGRTYLPILVITGDVRPEARQAALDAGARDFLGKPFDAFEARLRVANLLRTRELQLRLERDRDDLEVLVQRRTADLEHTQQEILEHLALAGEYRDDETHEHALRVGRTAALLAEGLGRPAEEVQLIRRAAPLHDIGKVGIPDGVLLLPGRLDDRQYALMKRHTVIGGSILAGSRAPVLRLAAEIALTHHERWDGGGYPAGLEGERIPWAGRVVAVADVFDALISVRPYKGAWSVQDAHQELRRAAGAQLDPSVVEAFGALDHDALVGPVTPLAA